MFLGFEEPPGRKDPNLADASQGEQVVVAGHDDIGLTGLVETVVVGVAGDRDRLGWGGHDGGQGKQLQLGTVDARGRGTPSGASAKSLQLRDRVAARS